jgi:hypothetical protein
MIMKKVLFVTVMALLSFIFVIGASAEDITIIGIKGKVLVRHRAIAPWKRAKLGQVLYKDCELKTKRASECTLSFGEGQRKTMNIKQNSHIKIADVLGQTIELSKGRVFSLIEKLDKAETFRVKTPTAIAGARGTGLGVVFDGAMTSAFCFEGTIFVEGFDPQGNSTGEKDVGEGFKVDVFEDGEISDLLPLSDEDSRDWDEFREGLKDLSGGDSGDDSGSQAGTQGSAADTEGGTDIDEELMQEEQQELREEQRDDFREDLLREQREQEEAPAAEDIHQEEVEMRDCWPYCLAVLDFVSMHV